ncbi:hypothetical protein Pcinc_009543 [Petrolisthes cinctipes]|uniref:Uncharacterized protein n=1 Tax=Petrolisthes cinctipes TaxID=88211 RepID=A0AAE1KVF9_PETCI|nr:hypothetical protein Pcinc_009543 [Petrolisthes cinctipes]
MLNEIPPDTPTIDLQFRMDGGVFNFARLCAKTKTTKTLLREMQYTDNNATPGSILTSTPTCKKDVENRMSAAHSAYGRLSCRVFNNHALTMATKIMVFQAIVLSTLLYVCQTWTLYRSDIQSLERFQQYKLRPEPDHEEPQSCVIKTNSSVPWP